MVKLQLFFLSLIPTLLGLFAFNQIQDRVKTQHHITHLTISAAISLKESLEEIKAAYQQAHPNTRLHYNFGASGSLQRQIENGVPVDLFFSAATQHIEALDQKQLLLSDTRKNILSNELVLITPKSKKSIRRLPDLSTHPTQYIALGNIATVPAGYYAVQALEHYQIWSKIHSKIVFTKDVRSVLTYVESGNVDAGFVYWSDAIQSQKIRVVSPIPSATHEPIIYAIVTLKQTSAPNAAREFIQFLSQNASHKIFTKYGFKHLYSLKNNVE